ATAGHHIYTSTNFGVNWTLTGAPTLQWNSIDVSADGSRLIAGAVNDAGAGIYTSVDSGMTWTSNSLQTVNTAVIAMSKDGSEMIASVNDGMWLNHGVPTPWLNIQPADESVALSWIPPSMPFSLQECLDPAMINWNDVTNVPALNFSTLQYEITLPTANRQSFYRLKSL